MADNVKIERNKNENNISVIRRFTRGVKDAGILPKVRSIRYMNRTPSSNVRRTKRLKSIEKKEEIEELIKMGKISQVRTRGRRR